MLWLMILMMLDGRETSLVCKFQTETRSSISGKVFENEEWLWFRDSERVERRSLTDDEITIWTRNQRGEIFCASLLNGHMITYLPADLRALERYPRWSRITQLLPRVNLAGRLEKKGSATHEGYPVVILEGVVGETRYVVHMSESYNIPLYMEIHNGGKIRVTRMIALHAGTSPWARTNMDNYPQMEFSDLGDNEWIHHAH